MNLLRIFKRNKHHSPEIDGFIEELEVESSPVILAVETILYGMSKRNISTLTLRRSQLFPSWFEQEDIFSLEVSDIPVNFDHITNRLKVLSNLNPWPNKKPLQGKIVLKIEGQPYICQTHFDDTADDPFVTLTMLPQYK